MSKFCENCGNELAENADICLKCGVMINNSSSAPVSEASKVDKNATVGMILGLVSIVAWLIPLFGYPVCICGIVFSAKGLKSTTSKGKATAGLILSIIFLVVTAINSFLGMLIGIEQANQYY